ncbi:MAG: hypothetical protein M0Q88_10025, partial [Bacilli bacterium]|nr:hypothetical protein [Bacilli bacterium]
EKYGGYDSKKTGYFFVVEHTHKKKRIKQIRTVPIMNLVDIQKDPNALMDYCINTLQLVEPKILIDKIHLHEKVRVDGFEMCVRGITGQQIICNGEHQLIIPQASYDYFVNIEKYLSLLSRNKTIEFTPNAKLLAESLEITDDKNIDTYLLFLLKEKSTIYSLRPANQAKFLEEHLNTFKNLNILEQCTVLTQINNLFSCNVITANLKVLGGGASAGIVKIANTIKGNLSLIRSSPTGVFTKEVSV